jgi:phosphohistidine phosphatase
MKLYFVRHGLSEDRETWTEDDSLRPLTKQGIARMKVSAETIKRLGVKPGLILTSPLVRARQTADILGAALDVNVVGDEALGFSFGIGALARLLEEYAAVDDLMLVGHEPDFSTLVQALIGGGRITVKKGSLIRVDLFSTTPPSGELVWSLPPKALSL